MPLIIGSLGLDGCSCDRLAMVYVRWFRKYEIASTEHWKSGTNTWVMRRRTRYQLPWRASPPRQLLNRRCPFRAGGVEKYLSNSKYLILAMLVDTYNKVYLNQYNLYTFKSDLAFTIKLNLTCCSEYISLVDIIWCNQFQLTRTSVQCLAYLN